jgi:hypothetical protein
MLAGKDWKDFQSCLTKNSVFNFTLKCSVYWFLLIFINLSVINGNFSPFTENLLLPVNEIIYRTIISSLPAFRKRYQLVHKAQNRNVLLLAGKACNKCRPTAVRKLAILSAYGRLLRLIFLQGCRARLHDKGAICAVWWPATAADCGARTFHKHGEICARSLVTCHCSSLRSTHAVWYPATAVWYPATAVWYPATAVWLMCPQQSKT